MKHLKKNSWTALCLLVLMSVTPLPVSGQSHPGFLIVAPDRGFLGNQETRTMVEEFQRDYPAALALIGSKYGNADTAYTAYVKQALDHLRSLNATSVVAIPLFLSDEDPQLHAVRELLPAYANGLNVEWAPAMSESYLIAQILLDRIEEISQSPETERLILVGIGARDETSEQAIKDDLTPLLQYVRRYKSFQDGEIVVYYDRYAEQAREKNKKTTTHVTELAAMQGRTLVVPAFIGVKFDHMMAMTSWFQRKFQKLNVVFQPEEITPHPNLLVWLKKTAHQHMDVPTSEIGVVIMPHGSTQPYNDAVEKTISPLTRH